MASGMKRLIVTADDFGLTPGVVAGIIEAHERGIVTATSLMVNADACAEASQWARTHPSLDVGLHLVLTYGRPVGPAPPLGALVSDAGTFRRLESGEHDRAEPEQVRREVRAQLDRFETMVGRPPTHIDGHHHVHALSGVFPVVLEEAQRTGASVRTLDASSRERARALGVRTPDRFEASFYGEDQVSASALAELLSRLGEGTTELMCHPSQPDPLLERISSYSRPRYLELESLTAEGTRAATEHAGIELRGTASG